MSRALPTGMASAVSAAKMAPLFFVQLDWPSGTVRAWNGYGDFSWNSQTWLGTGHLGSISPIKESRDLAANGVVLTISGIDSAQVARALEDDSQGRAGKIWFGLLKADGTFEVDPYLIFDGVIDICPTTDNGETSTIQVRLEKELIDQRTRGRRYTHEDQQIDYPGDMFLEFVAGLMDKEITWGAATSPGASTSPGGVVSDFDPTIVGFI